jgi:hypothetical protein
MANRIRVVCLELSTPRSKLVLVVLLLMSAVFASMSILPAYARSISLSPPNGPVATVVTVTGSGFSSSDTSCTISSSKSGLVTLATPCTMTGGSINPGVTFTIGPGIGPGTYTVTVTGDQVSDSASSSFTVLQPTITLTPQAGPPSTFVNVKSGSVKFSVGDTSCAITSTLVLTSTACSIVNGAVTGQFQVSGAAVAGAYEIDVTGTPSTAKATAIFTVTAGSVVLSVTPNDGPINTKITVQGSGFSSIDTSCQITATDPTTIAASPAPTCHLSSGVVTGTFYVGKAVAVNTPETITVAGSPGGDSASVSFTIDGSPQLAFTPSALEPPGTTVTLSIVAPATTQFSSGDAIASCTISSTPGGLFSSSACHIGSGGTDLTGTFFIVANVASGKSYTVTVKGNLGDSASAIFTVASPVAPSLAVVPSDGPPGTKINVQGTSFSGLDTACYITSTPTNIVTSQTCSVSGTTGKITGSFTVATGAAPGLFSIIVTGSTGDSASAPFTVDATPYLAFSPVSPQPPGTTVLVTLSAGQFSSGDASCTITSVPSGLFSSSACYIGIGGTDLTGTFFVVSAVATGNTYTVVVKGNLGDQAVGTFSVTVVTSLTLTPSYGYPTQTISFVGRGLSSTDTSCSVTSNTGPNGASLIGSSTCTMSAGTATGTFVVNSQATADGAWLVTVTGNPVGDTTPTAVFTVVPNITVTPKVGSVSTVVAVSGVGFDSTAVACTLSSLPNVLFAASPPASCSFIVPGPNGNGHIAGTFTVDSLAPAGTYVVTASDGTYSASATFQVGTPSAQIVITPNIAGPLQSVGVTGSGFSGNDLSCTITGYPVGSTASCNISGGTVGGSITLPAAPAPGLYLITVTGDTLDFASNYLAVPVTTGTATTSTSTTTSVTTTTATSITTSVPVTLTTTTFTNTGISTDRSYTLTTTTITGQFTSSVSTTTTMTSIITSSTSTTVSTMITTSSLIGGAIGSAVSSTSSQVFDGNLFGLISMMALLGWILVRRWWTL